MGIIHRTVRFITAACFLVGLAAGFSGSAHAATYVVTTNDTADDGVCDSVHCSLREALNAANADALADDIDLSAIAGQIIDVSGIPASSESFINVFGGPLTIGAPGEQANVIFMNNFPTQRTIYATTALGVHNITFSGGGNYGSHIRAEDTVTGTNLVFENAGVSSNTGGVIHSLGPVMLSGAEFRNNQGPPSGPGLIATPAPGQDITLFDVVFDTNNGFSNSGEITAATLAMDNVTFTGNTTGLALIVTDLWITGDAITAVNNAGGFIRMDDGDLVLTNAAIAASSVSKSNLITQNSITGGSAFIFDNVSITDTVFLDNAFSNASVIESHADTMTITDSTISGTSFTNSPNTSVSVLTNTKAASVSITGSTFQDNGGANISQTMRLWVDSVNLSDSVFDNNTAGSTDHAVSGIDIDVTDPDNATGITIDNTSFTNGTGRALFTWVPFAITDSTFQDNTVDDFYDTGAAITTGTIGSLNPSGTSSITRSVFSNNTAPKNGAAINVFNYDNVTLVITDSTFEGNTITGTAANAAGAAVFIEGGSTVFRNTTISGNTASVNVAAHYGAGVHVRAGAGQFDSTTITGNTLTGTSLNYDGAGIVLSSGDTVENSIIYGNTGNGAPDDCALTGGTSLGFNILGVNCEAFAGPTDITGADPNLLALAGNGGPVPTHDLAPGSPAIDAGGTILTADARGFSRPSGEFDDIGAVEWQWFAPSASSLDFGEQKPGTESAPQSVTFTIPYDVDNFSVSMDNASVNPDEFSVSGDCFGAFSSGSTCTADVTFTPAGLGGRSGVLRVEAEAGGHGDVILLDVGGNGVSGDFVISPFSIDFGALTVGDNASAGITVTADPGSPVDVGIIAIELVLADAGFSLADDCPADIPPGGTCTVTATFAPAAAGDFSATVRVTTDDFDTPTMQSALTGSAVAVVIDNDTDNETDNGTTTDNETDTGTVTGGGTSGASSSGGGGGGCSAGAGGGFGLLLLAGLGIIRRYQRRNP